MKTRDAVPLNQALIMCFIDVCVNLSVCTVFTFMSAGFPVYVLELQLIGAVAL